MRKLCTACSTRLTKQQDELPWWSAGSSVAKTKDDRWLRKLAMAINLQERRIEQVSILWSILIFALSRLEHHVLCQHVHFEVKCSRDITGKTRANFTGLPCPPNFNVIARGEAPRVRQIIEAVNRSSESITLLFADQNYLVKLLVKTIKI